MRPLHSRLFVTLALFAMSACMSATVPPTSSSPAAPGMASTGMIQFEQDREAILAMVGNYKVTFDFIETVSFFDGYALKPRKQSGAYEVVHILEDRGDFISLQHTLVVGPPTKPMIIKHWRQDWRYEPAQVLVFIGGNAWEWHDVAEDERAGAWSQTVYQVDDSPRYGGVGRWHYDNGLAEWTAGRAWRPLPRRDMTTRDDYHAVDAVNRHVITPWGWVHEQDNTKLVLHGTPRTLVREAGVNTYRRFDDFPSAATQTYWDKTGAYWAGIRAEWTEIESRHEQFAITIKGETTALYTALFALADKVRDNEMEVALALEQARSVIADFVTPDIGALADRLRPMEMPVSADY